MLSSQYSCVFTQGMKLCILSAKRTRSGFWYKGELTLGIVGRAFGKAPFPSQPVEGVQVLESSMW